MKRLVFVLFFAFVAMNIYAMYGGNWGSSVSWTLDNAVLTISQIGSFPASIPDEGALSSEPTAPWKSYQSQITSIVLRNITRIGENAFNNLDYVTSVSLPSTLTEIGKDAFGGCDLLASVTIPSGVTLIGESAFGNCTSLSSVSIPNTVTTIGDYAFRRSNLQTISIPNSVVSIGDHAFSFSSNLREVTLGIGITHIGLHAFYNCPNLQKVTCQAATPPVYDYDATLDASYNANADLYIPSLSWEQYMQEDCWLSFRDIKPYDISQYGKCGDNAYWFIKTIGSNQVCHIIGSGAMYDYEYISVEDDYWISSPLTEKRMNSIQIADGITHIGDYAFYYCNSLTTVSMPNSVISIGKNAFEICTRLQSVDFPESLTTIGHYAFFDCNSLTSITIPQNVSYIGGYAFSTQGGSSRQNIVWNASSCRLDIKRMDDRIWSSIMSFTIGNEVETIPDYLCYSMSSLTDIIIPNSVTTIGESAFSSCSGLTNITIPNSVTTIGESAFSWCSGLTSVTIGNSVTSIGDRAFYYCDRLTSITCETINPPTIGSSTFYGVSNNIPVYVPCGTASAYQSASYWSAFTNIQEMECEPAEYRRTTTSGNYGTICLPKAVAHDDIEGGVFFNIVYAVTNTNMDITGILMEEETGDLVAGKPYIFRATTDELVLPYTGAAVANPLAANGLVGNLSETPLAVPQGMYVLSNNQIRKLAGGTATAGQNRAYIDLTNVTKLNYVPSAAPNRVMLNVEGYSEATDLENLQSKDVQKVIRDGQLLIIRDGKTYNVLGINL